jgi:propanol-preferring alcohol dehydrogenase
MCTRASSREEHHMKAAVVHEFKAPLRLEEVAKPRPGADQIVVKLEASGLCHTDIHAAHGDWPVKPTLPLIPGHEGVGIVEMIGAGVTSVKAGDRVAIPWLGYACGSCEYCMSGWSTLCEKQINTGYFMDGAYAEYALAFAKWVVRVPKNVNPLEAAPLSCAGVTTYKAVKMSGARSSDLVTIFGIGGLGHLAVQYAKIAGATVVAVDLDDEKLALAKTLGADYTINGKTEDPVEAIKKLGGADSVVCVAVGARVYEQSFKALKRGGTLVFVAMPADNFMQLPIFETVLNGIKIVGSIVGTPQDLSEVYDLHAAGRTKVIYETRRLEQVNEAMADVEKARVPARLVFDLS